MSQSMFCFQCQETSRNSGCTVKGVCGKTPEVAQLQDLLIYLLKGISFWGTRGRNMGVVHPDTDLFVAKALFATITNANFDPDRFVELIREAIQKREALRKDAQNKCQTLHGNPCPGNGPDWASWRPDDYSINTLIEKAETVGVLADIELDEDIRSLRELITYGLKGIAAYIDHAYVLDTEDPEILFFIQDMLEATTNNDLTTEDLTNLVLKTGEIGLRTMALLDKANTSAYGHPEPTRVYLGVKPGPGILVSGHDLRDLDELLQQTQGQGLTCTPMVKCCRQMPIQLSSNILNLLVTMGGHGGSSARNSKVSVGQS